MDAAIAVFSDMLAVAPKTWTYARPLNGYKHAVRTPEGLQIHVGREDMGAHLIAPGSALSQMLAANLRIEELVGAATRENGSFSRVDCAIDVTNEGMDIHALQAAFLRGEADTRAKENNQMGDGRASITWYLGSWKSDHFLRIYNKYSQLAKTADVPDTEDWVRIELVNRDKYAQLAADLIYSTKDVPLAVRTMILAYVDFPTMRTWVRALRGSALQVGSSLRATKNTRRWLETSVATSLARELVSDPDYRVTWDRALASAIEAVRLENELNK
jgi:DNA relaxase NicK